MKFKSLLIFLFLMPVVSWGQTELKAVLTSDSIQIASPFEINLSCEFNPEEKSFVIIDSVFAASNNLEIVSDWVEDSLGTSVSMGFNGNIELMAFDTGYVVIPPFYALLDGDTIRSNPLMIYSLYPDVDILGDFKDVKSIVEVELTFWDQVLLNKWMIIGIIVGLIILLILIRYFTKKPKKDSSFVPAKVHKSPSEVAYERLTALQNKDLFARGLVKEHYIELSNIFRWYIEDQFEIQAMEETTDELISNLRSINVHRGDVSRMKRILDLSDMVKFAKAKPRALDHEQSIKDGRIFLENTTKMMSNED